jgi:hypothetical protein
MRFSDFPNYEHIFRKSVTHHRFVYFRFIDDVISIQNVLEVEKTKAILDNLYPLTIKWTHEVGDKLPFLDLLVKIKLGSSGLSYSAFSKPLNTDLYTSPATNYPDHYKFGWLSGENIRFLRNCSTKKDFEKRINGFRLNLKNRNYPKAIINKYVKFNWDDRPKYFIKHVNRFKKRVVVFSHTGDWRLHKQHLNMFLVSAGLEDRITLILGRGMNLSNHASSVRNTLLGNSDFLG